MSEIIKWGLLAVAIVLVIAMIMSSFGIIDFINISQFSAAISSLLSVVTPYLRSARGIFNSFLTSWGRTALTGLLVFMISKRLIMTTIKTAVGIYHFVFK